MYLENNMAWSLTASLHDIMNFEVLFEVYSAGMLELIQITITDFDYNTQPSFSRWHHQLPIEKYIPADIGLFTLYD